MSDENEKRFIFKIYLVTLSYTTTSNLKTTYCYFIFPNYNKSKIKKLWILLSKLGMGTFF